MSPIDDSLISAGDSDSATAMAAPASHPSLRVITAATAAMNSAASSGGSQTTRRSTSTGVVAPRRRAKAPAAKS